MPLKIIIFSILLSGCASYNPISDNQDTWVSEKILFTSSMFYCVANKQANGQALPICYEAKMEDRKPKIGIISSQGADSKTPYIGH